MKKDIIKELAISSFTKKGLDAKRVNRIVRSLGRKELKEYIRQLKIFEEKNKVLIEVSSDYKGLKNEIEKIFPSDRIEIKEKKDLILGMRITKNYSIYNLSLKNKLLNIVNYISE